MESLDIRPGTGYERVLLTQIKYELDFPNDGICIFSIDQCSLLTPVYLVWGLTSRIASTSECSRGALVSITP